MPESLSIKDVRRTAAAVLLLICAANSSRIFPMPVDSVEASAEANIWHNIDLILPKAGFAPARELSLRRDHTFSFKIGRGELQEDCLGYYQPKTETYTYIGSIVCN